MTSEEIIVYSRKTKIEILEEEGTGRRYRLRGCKAKTMCWCSGRCAERLYLDRDAAPPDKCQEQFEHLKQMWADA